MARNASSPFSSGSGGPIFELRTIAWYLLKMIGSGSPFSNRPGTIEKLSVQARPQGWLLDDIVLQMNNSGVIWRALISCKSGPLAGTEVWNETMHDAWEHLLGKNGFKAQVDLMVVETGIDSDEYVRLLRHLVVGASAFQDDTYHQRICATAEDIKSVISKERKEMYWKCKCPEDLLIGQTKITEPNELLRNILFRQRDWMVNSPESLADAIEVARNLLINGDENAGLNLWNSLIGVASDLNPVGGEFSRDQLISRLLSEGYAFYADANIRNDLEKVRQWCRNRSDGLVTHSMGELTIPRDLSIAELRDEMCSTQITILYGPSGAGKSSLSVRAFDSLPNGLLLYVPIESVLDGAWDLMLNGLQSPIARISSLSNSGITWLIDGAEKAIHQGREKDLSILISTLMPDRQTENRKIIIVTQSQAAEEIIGVCRSRKIPHSSVMIDVLQDADLQLIVAKYPQLRRLLLTDSINPIFRLPKVLEVIISNIGETEDINGIFGESDVVNWYWEKIVKRAVQPIGQKAILQLSQQQAETWQSETSLGDIANEMAEALPGAEVAGICKRLSWDKIAFTHDIIGDWIRCRFAFGKPLEWVVEVSVNAGWHAALKLWLQCQIKLHGQGGVWGECWRHQGWLGNLAIDALVNLDRPDVEIEKLWPQLVVGDGVELRRFLDRFLSSATMADTRIKAADDHKFNFLVNTYVRIPIVNNWLYLIKVIKHHLGEFIKYAPIESAKISILWLRHAPRDYIGSKILSELALKLGHAAWHSDTIDDARNLQFPFRLDGAVRRKCYEACFYAYGSLPEETKALLLLLSCRRLPAQGEGNSAEIRSFTPTGSPFRIYDGIGDGRDVPMPAPWLDGPLYRVDEEFRLVCLEQVNVRLNDIMVNDPELVGEILLALFLKEPHPHINRGYERHHDIEKSGLSSDMRIHMPHPDMSPWPIFLKSNRTLAIDTIFKLINHNTKCMLTAMGEGAEAANIQLFVEGSTREYPGILEMLSWNQGHSSHGAISSALMAIEQDIYQLLDSGEKKKCNGICKRLLENGNSCIFFGVLWNVARYKPELLFDPLLPLVSSTDLLHWEIRDVHTGFSGFMPRNVGEENFNKIKSWRLMPHKKIELRTYAPCFFFINKSIAPSLKDIINWWNIEIKKADTDEDTRAEFQRSIELYTYENWEIVNTEQGIACRFIPPQWMIDREQLLGQPANFRIRAFGISSQSSKVLSGEAMAESPEKCFASVKWLIESKLILCPENLGGDEDEVDVGMSFLQPIISVVAVLEIKHSHWMLEHKTEADWCRAAIVELWKVTPPVSPIYAGDRSQNSTEAFMAPLAVAWATGGSEEYSRHGCEIIMDLCCSNREASVGAVMRALLNVQSTQFQLIKYCIRCLTEVAVSKKTLFNLRRGHPDGYEAAAEIEQQRIVEYWGKAFKDWKDGIPFTDDEKMLEKFAENAIANGELIPAKQNKGGRAERERGVGMYGIRPMIDSHFVIMEIEEPFSSGSIELEMQGFYFQLVDQCFVLVLSEYGVFDENRVEVMRLVNRASPNSTYLEYPYQTIAIKHAVKGFINLESRERWDEAWGKVWRGGENYSQIYCEWMRSVVAVISAIGVSEIAGQRWREILPVIFSADGWIRSTSGHVRRKLLGIALGIEEYGCAWPLENLGAFFSQVPQLEHLMFECVRDEHDLKWIVGVFSGEGMNQGAAILIRIIEENILSVELEDDDSVNAVAMLLHSVLIMGPRSLGTQASLSLSVHRPLVDFLASRQSPMADQLAKMLGPK